MPDALPVQTEAPVAAPGERRIIAGQAGTVLVGQLAVMAFGVTDTIVAGRFSEDALASLSVGAAIFIPSALVLAPSASRDLLGLLRAARPRQPISTITHERPSP